MKARITQFLWEVVQLKISMAWILVALGQYLQGQINSNFKKISNFVETCIPPIVLGPEDQRQTNRLSKERLKNVGSSWNSLSQHSDMGMTQSRITSRLRIKKGFIHHHQLYAKWWPYMNPVTYFLGYLRTFSYFKGLSWRKQSGRILIATASRLHTNL